ncbi:ATP-binding protein [Gracilimonas sp.]|uniref:GAF domain-containing sensor histidine kinase n=1 Tax=Gracilimonas sp. TaxID=1974203 RepID=UPI0028728C36|nr:ATP-binding protein [Gracilimonas sp.]
MSYEFDIKKFKSLIVWSNNESGDQLTQEGDLENFYGYSQSDFESDTDLWFKVIHPDDKPYFQKAIRELKKLQDGSVNVQYRIIRKDSIVRNVLGVINRKDKDGQGQYTGYLVDVSHRNQNYDAKTRRKNILNLLSDSISTSFDITKSRKEIVHKVLSRLGEITNADRVYIFDKKSGNNLRPILNQNYEWCKKGIESQMTNDVVFDVDLKDLVPRWYENMVNNKKHISGLVRHLPIEERQVLEPQGIVSILVTPIWYDNEYYGFIGFDDCREERLWSEEEIGLLTVFGSLIIASWKYEDSIKKVEDQLKQVKKLQSEREQFLKMVSHQFKNPLSVVKSNTDLLKQACRSDSSNLKNILPPKFGRIERSIAKFEELIEAILIGDSNYSVDDNPEKIDFHNWLEEMFNTKKRDYNNLKSIELSYSEKLNKVVVPFSTKTFEYIMDTLFSNAVKYRGEEAANVQIHYDITGEGHLNIVFKDEGIGINEGDLESIGKPFFRANNVINTSGTGIGLSMVKDSLTNVGGAFEVKSKEGEYTTILISFPINTQVNAQQ